MRNKNKLEDVLKWDQPNRSKKSQEKTLLVSFGNFLLLVFVELALKVFRMPKKCNFYVQLFEKS